MFGQDIVNSNTKKLFEYFYSNTFIEILNKTEI